MLASDVTAPAWRRHHRVEFDRGTGSRIDRALRNAISSGSVVVTEPVLMEVLAGARDDERARDLRRLLTSFGWVPADPVADFEGAALLYRGCRAAGFNPGGLVDWMIADIGLRSEAELLAADRDFAQMATVVPLRIAS